MVKNVVSTFNKGDREYKLFEVNDVARYGMHVDNHLLDPIQMKALLYLLWKCNLKTPGSFVSITLPVEELGKALGYTRDENRNFSRGVKSVYRELKKLMASPVQIYDSESQSLELYSILTHVKMELRTGMLTVDFGPGLEKLFGVGVQKEFTVVKLMYLNRLKKQASIYLYPFFCRFRNMSFFSYDIKGLKKLLVGDENFEYKNLKRYHLLPAIEEINTKTDISITMKENFRGNKVISVTFHVIEEPSIDEMELFALTNGLGFDECTIVPYDDRWKNCYNYDMGKQKYIQKPQTDEYYYHLKNEYP